MARKLDFPVFDADNHMYETVEAFTRHLPPEHEGLVKYVQVNGRTKIALNNVISDYIPNPTFNKVAPPGAQEAEFQAKNPSSKLFAPASKSWEKRSSVRAVPAPDNTPKWSTKSSSPPA